MFVPELRNGSTPQKNKISPHGYAPPPDPFPPAGTEVPPLSETFSPYFATESRPFPRPSRRMDRPAPRARFSRRFPGPVLPAPRIAPPPSARFPASPPPPAVTSPCAPSAPLRAAHSGTRPGSTRPVFAPCARAAELTPASKWPSVILRAARPRNGTGERLFPVHAQALCRASAQRSLPQNGAAVAGAEPRHAPVQRGGLRKAGIARIGKSRPRNVGSKAVSAAVLANPWEGG